MPSGNDGLSSRGFMALHRLEPFSLVKQCAVLSPTAPGPERCQVSRRENAQVHALPGHSDHPTPRVIDLHQDILSGVALLDGGFPVYGSCYLSGSHRAAAVWSSLYPHHPESSLLAQLQAHGELLASHSSDLRLITTVEDLDVDDARTGVLPHSEGLPLPGVGPDVLDSLWAGHSLRSLSTTWNYETAYAYSCYDNAAAPLKPAGRRLLRALEASPLFLDLAHLNEAGFYQALDLYSSPVLETHSFCRSIVDHPRGLSDDQLRALGEHGGLVGLAFPPDFLGQHGSIDEALGHVERIATLAGEGAVSIGSDWGVAAMGELADPASLVELLVAVDREYGPDLAERFAFANADDFLRDQLPAGPAPA
jgi:microsomal dipeptidase-like Zn-dependent dipeptidase